MHSRATPPVDAMAHLGEGEPRFAPPRRLGCGRVRALMLHPRGGVHMQSGAERSGAERAAGARAKALVRRPREGQRALRRCGGQARGAQWGVLGSS
ncbi:unnamed protein product [Amoebophrya sp. A25]|nr:unnamed protein product [Amoebophrya sp. A25]|eukprot:GSA25T00014158001.1